MLGLSLNHTNALVYLSYTDLTGKRRQTATRVRYSGPLCSSIQDSGVSSMGKSVDTGSSVGPPTKSSDLPHGNCGCIRSQQAVSRSVGISCVRCSTTFAAGCTYSYSPQRLGSQYWRVTTTTRPRCERNSSGQSVVGNDTWSTHKNRVR